MTPAGDILPALRRLGLIDASAEPRVTPLTGGVSSDVYRVDLDGGPVCVKRAVAQLRVASDWRAPLERSHAEAQWLRTAAAIAPGVAPDILAEDETEHLFVMSFFEPANHPVWKARLMDGAVAPAFAGQVGEALARIHAATAHDPAYAAAFANDDQFHALRIEPYLVHTAKAHPDRAERLTAIAERLAASRIALVHGDVSPKNILQGPGGPILLDAECAWYGDPAFDLAFCLTHLLLKTVHLPDHAPALLASYAALKRAYFAGAAWEAAEGLDARAADLLAALLLARVDGKSPVEYLRAEAEQARVRETARRLLAEPSLTLDAVAQAFSTFKPSN